MLRSQEQVVGLSASLSPRKGGTDNRGQLYLGKIMLKSLDRRTEVHCQCSQCKIGYYYRPENCIFCGSDLLEIIEQQEPKLDIGRRED